MASPIQAAAIAVSAFAAGTTAAYTFLWIPSITFAADERTMIAQWRKGYRIGFYTAPPQVYASGLIWAYLAYKAAPSSRTRTLYTIAALLLPSIIPYTLTVQRAVNGALCLRAEKVAGPGGGTIAETYSVREARSAAFEKGKSTHELIEAWGRFNAVRVSILFVGLACGVWGVVGEANAV